MNDNLQAQIEFTQNLITQYEVISNEILSDMSWIRGIEANDLLKQILQQHNFDPDLFDFLTEQKLQTIKDFVIIKD